MKLFRLIFYIFFKQDLAFINSPLQFICFVEYSKKYKNNFDTIFIGYTSAMSMHCIKEVEKFYKNKIKLKTFYLNDLLNIHFLHFLLNIKKYLLFNYKSILVGDHRYYLHRKIATISKKKIFIDDGFSSIYFNKFYQEKVPNSIFFTTFPQKYNVSNVIENNFGFLKKIYKSKKVISKNSIFLLSAMSEKKFMTEKQYFYWISKLLKKIKGPVTIIPHRSEIKLFRKRKNLFKKKHNIQINYLPIEISLGFSDFLPGTIIHNYSSCAITLKKILKNKKINILNYDHQLSVDIAKKFDWKAMEEFLSKNNLKSISF